MMSHKQFLLIEKIERGRRNFAIEIAELEEGIGEKIVVEMPLEPVLPAGVHCRQCTWHNLLPASRWSGARRSCDHTPVEDSSTFGWFILAVVMITTFGLAIYVLNNKNH